MIKPDVLKMMLDRYNSLGKETEDKIVQGYYVEKKPEPFPNACKYMNDHGGYWQPWVNV